MSVKRKKLVQSWGYPLRAKYQIGFGSFRGRSHSEVLTL